MNGKIEGMRMGHSGELLAVYLAIGPAVTDEELAKTFLLMFKRCLFGTCGFRGTWTIKKDASNASRKPIYYGRLESKLRFFDFGSPRT